MDTHQIGSIYRRRPTHLADVQMGRWFCLANKLDDAELWHSHSVDHTKDVIIREGYNEIDPAILILFNQLSKAH